MKMLFYDAINRRMFLRLAGGGLASIPFLPSLVTRALGQTPLLPMAVVHIVMPHGPHLNSLPSNMHVDPALVPFTPNRQVLIDTGHFMREYLYSQFPTTGPARLYPGPICDLFSGLSSTVLQKMASLIVSVGNDGHKCGGIVGSGVSTNADIQPALQSLLGRSVSTVLANNQPGFNPAASGGAPNLKQFVVSLNQHWTNSWDLSGSTVVATPQPATDTQTLYNLLFPSGGPLGPRGAFQLSLLNETVNKINTFLSPTSYGARLSSEDRLTLESYQGTLNSIRTGLQGSANGCNPPAGAQHFSINTLAYSTDLAFIQSSWNTLFDLLAAAIACGATRVADLSLGQLTDYTGDFHADIAHLGLGAAAIPRLTDNFRLGYNLIGQFVQRLDSAGILDRTLVVGFPELSDQYHGNNEQLISLFGAGIQGGRMLDPRKSYNAVRFTNCWPGLHSTALMQSVFDIVGRSWGLNESNLLVGAGVIPTGMQWKNVAGGQEYPAGTAFCPPSLANPSYTDSILNRGDPGFVGEKIPFLRS